MRGKVSSVLVIGIGNEFRRDDGAGRAVARALQPPPKGVRVLEQNGEGAALMDAWAEAEKVILIDAVSSGAPSGTVHRLDAIAGQIPRGFFHCSSHAFSVAEAVELARTLGQLPPQLVLYGIEGKDFNEGTGLSRDVERAAVEVARRVRNEIGTYKNWDA